MVAPVAQEALRVLLAALAFFWVCYFDVRRFCAVVTVPGLLVDCAVSFALVAPLFPFLVVVASTALLLLVSVLQFLSIDTEPLNPVVYVGTLYSPFAMVYYNTKKRALRGLTGAGLPTSSSYSSSHTSAVRAKWAATAPRP